MEAEMWVLDSAIHMTTTIMTVIMDIMTILSTEVVTNLVINLVVSTEIRQIWQRKIIDSVKSS